MISQYDCDLDVFTSLLSFQTGVWAHGDFCKINPDNGGILMLGRR